MSSRQQPSNGSIAELDPVRQLILDRAREQRLPLAHLARALQRNDSYLHQFVHRGTPRRLPEEARAILADLLHVPENALRSTPNRDGRANPAGVLADRKRRAVLPAVTVEAHGPDIPVYSDEGTVVPGHALDWVWRPARLVTAKGAFALWISRPRGRLRPGDLAYVRIGQPARVGDIVVAVQDDTVEAVGDLLAMDDRHAEIREGDARPSKFARQAVRLLHHYSAGAHLPQQGLIAGRLLPRAVLRMLIGNPREDIPPNRASS